MDLFDWPAATDESWLENRLCAKDPLNSCACPRQSFIIDTRSPPQFELRTFIRGDLSRLKSDRHDSNRTIGEPGQGESNLLRGLSVIDSWAREPRFDLPPEPFGDEQGAPWAVMAPQARETVAIAQPDRHLDHAAAEPAVSEPTTKLFGEQANDKQHAVDPIRGGIERGLNDELPRGTFYC
jgi:hypothetical protein